MSKTEQGLEFGGHSRKYIGQVVDTDDPEGRGRVQILTMEQISAGIKPDKGVWIPCMRSNEDATNRHVGTYPGHNYTVGAKIIIESLGDEDAGTQYVMGNVPGDDPKSGAKDIPKPSSFPFAMFNWPGFNELQKAIEGALENGMNDPKALKQLAANFNSIKDPKALAKALDSDPIKRHLATQFDPFAKKMEGIYSNATKEINEAMSKFDSKEFDVKSLTKNIQQKLGEKGDLIKNSSKMIEKLKETIKGGSPSGAKSALGGIGNVQGALASIAKIGNGIKNNEDDFCDELCDIYKEITGQECKDAQNKFTQLFFKWKKEYLRNLIS
jgi:hypothetical protein